MPTSIALLPQSPQGLLLTSTDRLRILILKKGLIDEAIAALEDFYIFRRTEAFDGHVGETLCQIRAYHIFLLASEQGFYNSSISNQLKKLRELSFKITVVIDEYDSNLHRREEYQTIVGFLEKNEILCELNDLTIYLAQLHLLSRFKLYDVDEKITIDYKAMCASLKISKHTARRIIHLYQIKISQQSVDFIRSLIASKNSNAVTKDTYEWFCKIDEDGRYTLPCYWVMNVLYEDMIKKKCSILVVCEIYSQKRYADTIFLLYKPSVNNENNYINCSIEDVNPKDLHFVLKGIMKTDSSYSTFNRIEYKDHFIKRGIKNILFANMASHPQYSGKKLVAYQKSPYASCYDEMLQKGYKNSRELGILLNLHFDQQQMSNYATLKGCGKFDHCFFYIRHIYCDTLDNQMKSVKISNLKTLDKHASSLLSVAPSD